VARDLRDELARAEGIGAEAAKLLLEGWGGRVAAETKRSACDLVTEYDLASERLLRERLADAFPGTAVVGEEEGGADADRVWYVDPLDGTTNFAHGHPFFCVSLGLVEEGQRTIGVVVAPAMGLLFGAARGVGARRRVHGAAATTLRVSETTQLSDSLLASGFPSDRATNPRNNYRRFRALDAATHGVRRCAAAALELGLAASGAYDGFWDIGLAPWDLAAGALLVEEAGGRVTALDGSAFDLHGSSVLATNGRLHDSLRAALAAVPDVSQDPAASDAFSHGSALLPPAEVH
jgi:myo-inositol-1(or 4)-monophosphatase